MEVKILFNYYVGELNLRTNRIESERKFGGVNCLYGICCGEDSIPHILTCEGYSTKAPHKMSEVELGQCLINIH